MVFLRNLKVGTKLIIGFIIVALIAGGIGLIGVISLDDIGNVQMPSVEHLISLEQTITAIQGIENLLLVPQLKSDEKQKLYDDLSNFKAEYDYHRQQLAALPFAAEEIELWNDLNAQLAIWIEGHEKFISLSRDLDSMKIEDPAAIRNEISLRQRDHYSWIWQLSESITTGGIFSGQVNDRMCSLGLWLSSYETENEQFNTFIDEIKAPHQAVHEAGSEITAILQAGRGGEVNWQEQALAVYDNKAVINMNQTLKLLSDIDALVADSYRIQNQMMTQALNVNRDSYITANSVIAELVEIKTVNSLQRVDSSSAFMLNLTLVALGLSLLLGFIISISIKRPLKKMVDISERLAVGEIEIELKSRSRDEIGALMNSFSKMIENTRENAKAAQMMARGDLSADICPKSEKDVMAKSMCEMTRALNGLVAESEMLTQAAVAGKLEVRGDSDKFQGNYRQIVEGVNKTLDAVIEPLNVAADYVDRISKGDIPEEITMSYNGDFNTIKNNINTCIKAVNTLVEDAVVLADAAVNGQLDVRADAERHQGSFAKIINGVNDTLDAVIKPVKEASAVLSEMAKGNLSKRVEGNFKGDHALIKDALNSTLDEISVYINDISYVLSGMANADLDIEVTRDYKGDFIEIKEALNHIIASFNNILTEFSNAADQVAAGAGQVSEGSTSLSQGTTEQASSIQELTASITQLSSQTRDNANSANQANVFTEKAKDIAENGNSRMHQLLESMQEIATSSNNISRIIKVIDDIAFQTNILALNAAVEAARAGQHGKGFAVVAEEVRNLAMRSAQAAKETTALIEGSINSVELGSNHADTTAQALEQIVEDISSAAELVSSIAAASNEQASAIVQINEGVQQVSHVVQANSATAEQSAASSEELSSQARLLKEQVGRFKLKQNTY